MSSHTRFFFPEALPNELRGLSSPDDTGADVGPAAAFRDLRDGLPPGLCSFAVKRWEVEGVEGRDVSGVAIGVDSVDVSPA